MKLFVTGVYIKSVIPSRLICSKGSGSKQVNEMINLISHLALLLSKKRLNRLDGNFKFVSAPIENKFEFCNWKTEFTERVISSFTMESFTSTLFVKMIS